MTCRANALPAGQRDAVRTILLGTEASSATNLLPNGRSATFFNVWAGRRLRPRRFHADLREDLSRLLALLADGTIAAQVARRFPLANAAEALRFAEAGGNTGKVVLVP